MTPPPLNLELKYWACSHPLAHTVSSKPVYQSFATSVGDATRQILGLGTGVPVFLEHGILFYHAISNENLYAAQSKKLAPGQYIYPKLEKIPYGTNTLTPPPFSSSPSLLLDVVID